MHDGRYPTNPTKRTDRHPAAGRRDCQDYGINPTLCRHFIVGERKTVNGRWKCEHCGGVFTDHLRVNRPRFDVMGWTLAIATGVIMAGVAMGIMWAIMQGILPA